MEQYIPWVLLVALGLLVLTRPGRRLLRIGDTAAQQGLNKIETAELQKAKLEAQVTSEIQGGLTKLEAANASAQGILADDSTKQRELEQWRQNLADAKAAYVRLTSDGVSDDAQQRQIGEAVAHGNTALLKVQAMESELTSDPYLRNLQWARDTISESERYMRELPAMAQQRLSEGNIAAAAQVLAQAEVQMAHGQSAFSGQGSQKTLEDMQRRATKAQSEARAARSRATHAPASSSVVALQLASLGNDRPFLDYVGEQKLIEIPAKTQN